MIVLVAVFFVSFALYHVDGEFLRFAAAAVAADSRRCPRRDLRAMTRGSRSVRTAKIAILDRAGEAGSQ